MQNAKNQEFQRTKEIIGLNLNWFKRFSPKSLTKIEMLDERIRTASNEKQLFQAGLWVRKQENIMNGQGYKKNEYSAFFDYLMDIEPKPAFFTSALKFSDTIDNWGADAFAKPENGQVILRFMNSDSVLPAGFIKAVKTESGTKIKGSLLVTSFALDIGGEAARAHLFMQQYRLPESQKVLYKFFDDIWTASGFLLKLTNEGLSTEVVFDHSAAGSLAISEKGLVLKEPAQAVLN